MTILIIHDKLKITSNDIRLPKCQKDNGENEV